MERTEHREEFFRVVLSDPYQHALTSIWTDAHVLGQEAVYREIREALDGVADDVALDLLDETWRARSWSERRDDALRALSDDRRRTEAQLAVAMAGLGAVGDRRRPIP